MSSIHASMGEPQRSGAYGLPAHAAKGASCTRCGLVVLAGEEVIKQGLPFEECKVTPHFLHVERAAIGLQQGPEIVEITGTGGIVDERPAT